MTGVLVALIVAVAALVGVGFAVVLRQVRGLQQPAAAVEPDEAVVQTRVDALLTQLRGSVDADRESVAEERAALAAQRREVEVERVDLDGQRQSLERAVRQHEDSLREAAETLEENRRLADDAARRLGEAERAREAAEAWSTQERADLRALRAALEARDERLGQREERLLAEGRTLESRSAQLVELRTEARQQRDAAVAERADQTERARAAQQQVEAELQRIAGLDAAQARAEVLARAEHEARLEATTLARDIEQAAVRDADQRARMVITTAIQRLAAEQTSESVVSTLDLPSDEMKGRIIGREGRNIRHFEQVTGVNVMIDDTPGSVLISCFDPVRREVARLTLAELVADGRIHPARIEEVHERSRDRIETECIRAAEDALVEVGISDLDPDLLPVLGSLRYRTSYGQNVLRHLVECAHVAGMMAAELGLDVEVCKRAAFLHDIGKALTHEAEGSHAMVGAELARRHGESPEIVHAIAAHHNEVEPTTVEAILTQAADAISGSRPGARRESLEAYVHRLERLEEIASAHEGVDRVFAMQAGREVRVMVSPDELDDNDSHALARDIAREIQDELTYPGQIRVTVVRESRATQIAH